MARTAKITLDGVDYVVHALNVGQLERVTEAFDAASTKSVPFAVLRIAMQRAEPPAVLDDIEATMDEVSTAFRTVMELAGIQFEKKANGVGDSPLAQPTALN